MWRRRGYLVQRSDKQSWFLGKEKLPSVHGKLRRSSLEYTVSIRRVPPDLLATFVFQDGVLTHLDKLSLIWRARCEKKKNHKHFLEPFGHCCEVQHFRNHERHGVRLITPFSEAVGPTRTARRSAPEDSSMVLGWIPVRRC